MAFHCTSEWRSRGECVAHFLRTEPSGVSNFATSIQWVSAGVCAFACISQFTYFAVYIRPLLGLSHVAALLAATLLATCYSRSQVVRESLRIISSLGLQLETETAGGSVTRTFVPLDTIDDVLINEAFEHFRVVTFLVVVTFEKECKIPFRVSSPSLEWLIAVRTCAQELLCLDRSRSDRIKKEILRIEDGINVTEMKKQVHRIV